MAYTKQNFQSGATLTASQMNNIDNALKSHDDDIASLKTSGGSGGSTVSVTRKTTSGTNIADITIDGQTTQLYAPTSTGGNSYTLPTASSTTLGGVKPVAKTTSMTQEVGVDSSGRLYTTPSSGGTSLTQEQLQAIERAKMLDDDYIRGLIESGEGVSY